MNIVAGDRLLQFLGNSVLLERLFWATVELTVLAAMVWIFTRLFRKLSPRVRALLWLLVLVKPLIALCVGAVMPIFELEVTPPPLTMVQENVTSPLPAATTAVPETKPVTTPPTASETSAEVSSDAIASTMATAPVQAIPATRPETRTPQPKITWPDFHVTFAYSWIAIALLLGMYKGLDVIRLRRLIRTSNVPSTALKERYEAIANQIGVKHLPRLCITETLETPALAGVLRPVILLPQWMLNDKHEAAVGWALRHELIHWKHGDTLANLLRQITQVLFFFHPLAWSAGKRWEEEAELACDRALINTTDEANEYAHSLYEVLDQLHGRRQRALATGLFATRTQVGRRITALMTNPLRHSAKLSVGVILVLALIAAFTLPVGGVFSAKEDMRAVDDITVNGTDKPKNATVPSAETEQDNTRDITIEVGSLSAPSSFVPWLEKEIASFRNSHPDIEVRTHLLREPQRLERPLYEYPPLAKNVIGIDSMPGFETAFLVNNGLLVPIDQFLPDSDFDINDFPENYFDSVTYQGKIWGIPWFTTNDVLLCDMSVLNAAGIQEPPATWDDVLQCIEKVVCMKRTDTITNPMGLRVDTSNDTAPGILMSYILQKDGYVLREGRFDLSHPAVEEGLIFLHQLAFNTEGVVIDRRSVRAVLEDSTVQYAMQIVPVNQLEPVIDVKRLRIAPLPTAGKEVTACEMRLYFAVRKASEAEEKASWEFIKWMSRPDVSLPPLWKGFPCRKDIVQRPEFIAMSANGIQNFEVAVTSAWRGVDVGDQVINRAKGFDALWSGLVPVLVAGTELSSVAETTTQMANDAINIRVDTKPQYFENQATDLSIQGRIYDVDTGKGIAGVLVRVFPGKGGANLRPTSLTGPDGIYKLSPLSTGEYLVMLDTLPEYPVGIFSDRRKEVALSKDNSASGIDFALKRGIPIRGSVKNQDGTPASGAWVGATVSTSTHTFRAESDVNGQFVIYVPGSRVPSSGITVSLQSLTDSFVSTLLSDQTIPAKGLEDIQLILDQPRTGSISGVIVDTDGKPVADLNVAPWNMTSSVLNLGSPTKTTKKGLFVCDNLAAGEYAIVVAPHREVQGFSKSDEYARVKITTGEQVKDIEIVFGGLSKKMIAGTVRNTRGLPVGGATIVADYRGHATSSDEGYFQLEHFSNKEIKIQVRHPDYATAHLSVNPGSHDVSIVLQDKFILQGHVVESGSRKPLSHFMIGYRLGLFTQMHFGLYGSAKPVESTNGFFQLEEIQDVGDYTMIAWADGFAPVLRTVTIEQATTELELALEPIAPVNGNVVDEQGASVNDACIYFIALPNLSVLEQVTVARSDNNGHFSLSSPPRELAWLAAYKPGYAIGVARNSDNWRIVLPQSAVVEGVVHGEDINLEKATVSTERQQEELPGYSVPIDDFGKFRIPDLLPGTISIKAQVKNPSQYIKHTMQIEAGATKHVEFTFESGTGTVEGIVTKMENPTRLYGLRLERVRDGYSDVMTTSLGNDGYYKFENVWSGELILHVEYLDIGNSSKGMQPAGEVSFTLKPGENKYQDFAL